MPKFIEADNGLAASAALRGGNFVTRVILHFAGLDPPLVWVPPPKTAEVIPAWMDEPVVVSARLSAIGGPSCAGADLGQLAARLQEPVPAAPVPRSEGLIHVDAPAARAVEPQSGFDSRAIYGQECVRPG